MTADSTENKAGSGADDKKSTPATGQTDERDQPERPREIGGRDGPDPTRYGDWEKAGRCIDF